MLLKIFGGVLLILLVMVVTPNLSHSGNKLEKYQTSYQQRPRNYYITFEAPPGLTKAPWIEGEITLEKLQAVSGAIEVSSTELIPVSIEEMLAEKPKSTDVVKEEPPPPTHIWRYCSVESGGWNCKTSQINRKTQQSFLNHTGKWLR